MTVASVVSRNTYIGAGSTEIYNYTFKIFEDTDLLVTVKDTDDVETELILNTDYTVTDAGETAGGTIVLVDANQDWLDADGDLLTGYTITIRRVLELTQDTDIRNQGAYFPEIHENTFDRLTMISQQLQDEVDRAIKLPETIAAADFDITLPLDILDSADKVLVVNSDGDGFEMGVTLGTISGAAAAAAAAAASAAAALASETAAATAETNAETAETNAETAETNAEAAQVAAETAETNAETAATAAAASASAASTSASGAATSATTATTQASAASTSATAAATSATGAATSATNAATSATNAANSATAADSSADAADASAIAADASADAAAISAAAAAAAVGLTTKGDLLTYDTATVRLAVGSNLQVLEADSSAAKGVAWATPANKFGSSQEISNLGLAASVAANALTISLKDAGGNNASATSPVHVGFRSATVTLGTYTKVSITGALSTVISSGSTAGFFSGQTHFLFIYLINNAGTAELAWSQVQLDEGALVTTTAEGGAGAADSNATVYSTTARASVACRLIGRFKFSLTTAGTWDAVPTEIKLAPFRKEIAYARYTTNAGQSLTNNTTTIIDIGTKISDSMAMVVVGASWRCVAPFSGHFTFIGRLQLTNDADWTTGENCTLFLYKSGSVIQQSEIKMGVASSSNFNPLLLINFGIYLIAGEYVDFRINQISGGAVALETGTPSVNDISIFGIGA